MKGTDLGIVNDQDRRPAYFRTSVNIPEFLKENIDSVRGNIPRTVFIRELLLAAMCNEQMIVSAVRGGLD